MIYFKLILSILPLLIIAFYFIYLGKKSSIFSSGLLLRKCGIVCFNCSERIINESDYKVETFENSNNLTQCKSCHRESQLNKINGKILTKDKLRKFLLGSKFEKSIFIIALVIVLQLVSWGLMGDSIYDSILSSFNQFFLITYWSLNSYKLWFVIENK